MPEGDTIHKAARRLREAIVGHALTEADLPRVTSPAPAPGTLVAATAAHGKYLVVHFDDGHAVLTHLKMTGAWRVLRPDARRPPLTRLRVWLATAPAVAVCIDAPVAELLDQGALRRHPGLRQLGPDLCLPDVDLDAIVQRAGRFALRGAPVSDLLLDQRVAAGIGNVYKSEVCFLHGLHPTTPVEHIGNPLRRELFATAAELLQANLDTTKRTTVPDAGEGALWVYGRRGRPCRRCATPIAQQRTGRQSRVTSWCPTCQPAPTAPGSRR